MKIREERILSDKYLKEIEVNNTIMPKVKYCRKGCIRLEFVRARETNGVRDRNLTKVLIELPI